jgi:hypothetical protein
MLFAQTAVREIAGRDDQLRLYATDQCAQRTLDLRILVCTRVQIGYMEEGRRHDRMRL